MFAAWGLAACTSSGAPRGTAPADADLSFAFGLARDQDGLAEQVWDTSTPSSSQYADFLSLPEIADKYGADTQTVDSAMATLTDAGFDGAPDPTRGVITGTFSVAEAEAFFGRPVNETVRDDGTAYLSQGGDLTVPAGLQPEVVEVFGGWATSQPAGSTAPTAPATPPEDPPCPSNERGLQARAAIDELYGLGAYDRAGLTGAGIRVGILSTEHYSPRALQLYERCFDRDLPPVQAIEVDNAADRLDSGNIETSMDLAFMGAIAPGIETIDVFQFDKMTSMIFPLAAVEESRLDPDQAVDILSTSVGFCASQLNEDERAMSDWLAMTLAVNGVTFLASSGDGGSSSCYPPNKQESTQYPSVSAFATSIGGTQIDNANEGALGQSVWNESPAIPAAGGGGPATDTPRPPYQSALDGPDQRQTPDLAFVAAPGDVGPIAYCNRGEPCKFRVVAGTSATAPGIAAVLARMLEYIRQTSPEQMLGLLNPAIYQFAQGPTYSRAYLDVTKGNNDLFNVGCCTATPGYDMASGWGSLRLDEFGLLIVDALQNEPTTPSTNGESN